MTTKLEQAARQALEALQNYANTLMFVMPDYKDVMRQATLCDGDRAITALREALAEQAEQEPVAWVDVTDFNAGEYKFDFMQKLEGWNYLYAAPVRTKDLTDDAIDDIALESGGDLSGNSLVWFSFHDYYKFARAVIAADREKNK